MHEEFWFMKQNRCTSMLNRQFIVQVYFLLKNLSLLFSVLSVASEAETQSEFFESAPIHVCSCAEIGVSEGRQLPKLISCSYVTSYSPWGSLTFKLIQTPQKWRKTWRLKRVPIAYWTHISGPMFASCWTFTSFNTCTFRSTS